MINGLSTFAKLNNPRQLVAALDGSLVFADYNNNRIRFVTMTGMVQTLAGSGSVGYSDAVSLNAMMLNPVGVTMDSSGNIIFADTGNCLIRKFLISGANLW